MPFDQSWMASGWAGAAEAGALSVLAGCVCYLVLARWLRDRRGHGEALAWALILALLLGASGDLWNLFYFNYARLQSVTLLRARLAGVHDPQHLGLRVMAESVGAVLGVALGWLLAHWRPGRRR